MARLPTPPEEYEPDIAFDDESIPLYVRRDEAERMMRLALRESKQRGLAWAQAEARYYSAKARETMALHDLGYPATLIQNLIKGQPETNALLKEKNEHEVAYKNSVEAVNAFKLIVRVLEADIEREWNDAKRM